MEENAEQPVGNQMGQAGRPSQYLESLFSLTWECRGGGLVVNKPPSELLIMRREQQQSVGAKHSTPLAQSRHAPTAGW